MWFWLGCATVSFIFLLRNNSTCHQVFLFVCLFFCPIQIMDIQDLLNNQTKLILTRLNQTLPNQTQLNQTKLKTKAN